MNINELHQEFNRLTVLIDRHIDCNSLASKIKTIRYLAEREVVVCKIERIRKKMRKTDDTPPPNGG